jgi:hypothetical protein
MGYGPVTPGGKQLPITPWAGSWADTVNQPIPQHIKDHHADQHAATHTQRKVVGSMTHAEYCQMKGLPKPSKQWPIGGEK